MSKQHRIITFTMIAALCLPATAFACACGCNVFSVGSRWMMPISAGYSLSLVYNYMDQTEDWNNWAGAPAGLNDDKQIRTSFYTLGFQDMINREWGIMVQAPIWNRYFKTIDDDGDIASVDHVALGDVKVMGMYTGLSEDMSTGIQFGLKLPTGPFNESLMDRDTQIGSGTTDLLLGGYQMGQENGWGWYAQALWQHAFNSREGYRPGDSFDFSVGAHYDNLLDKYKIVPMLQLIASFRGVDSGVNSDPEDTGYDRLYVSPSLQVNVSQEIRLYGDLRIPVVTHVRGYQLIAPSLLNTTLSFNF
ncbi:MAG: hypothetical protein ACLP05_13050 [Candidatus Kryptoniota bacterium]